MFKILLDGGCLLNCRAFSTLETPLYRAIDTMKTEIAELFLVHGADPNLSSPFDITALQKACIRGNTHLVKLLLHCGIQWKKERWLPQENVQSLSFSGSIQIKDLILKWRSTVPSLQYLCRIRTRYFLEENLEYKLSNIIYDSFDLNKDGGTHCDHLGFYDITFDPLRKYLKSIIKLVILGECLRCSIARFSPVS
ncbi:hypothetical protein KUTeg_018628 [Tegillarca granosa]|uniref:Uncharacterized protein n=1 Tax=Tegillarca granosa TaxID=220873 RepID=A0ABQ9EJY1_TEGGR|nr:hypothetical protein KUTeg_018628 [Tegillarca granosa]